MKVYRSLESVPPDFGPSALTIGNFDGVHFGHRQILRRVIQVAGERGCPGVSWLDAGLRNAHPGC